MNDTELRAQFKANTGEDMTDEMLKNFRSKTLNTKTFREVEKVNKKDYDAYADKVFPNRPDKKGKGQEGLSQREKRK